MDDDLRPDYRGETRWSRRGFLNSAALASLVLTLPRGAMAAIQRLKKPVQIGVIADLHHDVMHDGADRLGAFLKRMSEVQPDAILQLGDFAYPSPENRGIIRQFNDAHSRPLHVIGNHDLDMGLTTAQCVEEFRMPGRYYAQHIEGLQLLVLDGNDRESPSYKGGYPSYVGAEQVTWLKAQLATLEGPIIVACHQPLAGPFAVDNANEIQEILGSASDKVILVINGHSHIDEVVRVKDVTYLHVNSASYQWVGSDHRHQSYAEDVHEKHPWISCTCPYREPLFATITIDPEDLSVRVEGVRSSWVGASPAELGVDVHSSLTVGEEIAPRIRDRRLMKVITVTKNQP